jgi:hypothetical protein
MNDTRKRSGEILMIFGFVLLLTAVAVEMRQQIYRQRNRVQTAQIVLQSLQKLLQEEELPSKRALLADPDVLPVVEVNGFDCIGKIEIMSSGISFPVGSRYLSIKRGQIPMVMSEDRNGACIIGVISGSAGGVREGDEVVFTDVNGTSCSYVVDRITKNKEEADGEVILEFSGGLHNTYISCVTE